MRKIYQYNDLKYQEGLSGRIVRKDCQEGLSRTLVRNDCMSVEKIIVVGWDAIAKFTPFSAQTVVRRFGRDMQEKGFVLKCKIGRSKRPRVWAYPDMVKKYFILLGQKGLL